jgi:RNA recognition motif-containing protein
MILHVGNLPFEIEVNTLRAFFEIYGEVANISIVTDKITGLSKGFGFVEIHVQQEAEKAIAMLHNKEIIDRTITVQLASHQTWK